MSSASPPPQVGFKKRRLQGSCDMCKRKKIKCDSAKMPDRCSNCIAFDCACTHNTAKRATRAPQKPDFESSSTSIKQIFNQFRPTRDFIVQILTNPTSKAISDDPKTIQQQLLDLAVYARHLEHELQTESSASWKPPSSIPNSPYPTSLSPSITTERFAPSTERSPPEGSDSEGTTISTATSKNDSKVFSELSGSFEKLTFDGDFDKTKSRLLTAALARQTHPHKLTMNVKRPEFWKKLPWLEPPPEVLPPLIFPPQDLLWSLTTVYFERVNLLLPLLHQPTFERLVSEGFHHQDRWFGQSVLAVCAIGARYSEDPRVLLVDAPPDLAQFSAGHKYFCQIDLSRCVRRSFEKNTPVSVYEVQTCCLVLSYLQGTSLVPSSFAIVGLAMRLAQSVGAHEIRGKVTAQKELWRRCFWVLIFHDILMSATSGRPRVTNPNDYVVDMIAEVDDEYWEHPTDESRAFQQPSQKPSKLTFFVHFIKLLDIVGFAQRTIYSVRQSHHNKDLKWVKDCLDQIHGAMDSWRLELPSFLQWDPHRPDISFVLQSALLSSTYYAIQIEILNPFIIDVDGSELAASSLSLSVQAARSNIKLLSAQTERDLLPLPHVQIFSFISAFILIISLWDCQRSGVGTDPTQDIDYIHKAIGVLRYFERRWQMSGRLIDIITALLNHDPEIRQYVPSPMKRPSPKVDERPSPPTPSSYTVAVDVDSSPNDRPAPLDFPEPYLMNLLDMNPYAQVTAGTGDPTNFAAMFHTQFHSLHENNSPQATHYTSSTTLLPSSSSSVTSGGPTVFGPRPMFSTQETIHHPSSSFPFPGNNNNPLFSYATHQQQQQQQQQQPPDTSPEASPFPFNFAFPYH